MSSCNHKVFYIHELSALVCRIVDNEVQYTDTSKDGYRVCCYTCGYDRTFKYKDKFPQWLKNRVSHITFESYTNKGL